MRAQQKLMQRVAGSFVAKGGRGGPGAPAGDNRRFYFRAAAGLVMLLLLSASAQAQGESCSLQAKGVEVGMKGLMCAYGEFDISLAGVTASGMGFQCDGLRDQTPKVWPKLIPDQTYTLTAGSAICVTTIKFDVPPCYKLEIDGKEADQIHKQDGGRIFTGDGTWKVVLRRKCPCEGEKPTLGSVIWQTGMGSLSDGRSAQGIAIRETVLSAAIYTPSALVYSPPGLTSEVDVVRDGNGALRQVKAPQMFADVFAINGAEYEIRYYRPTNVGAKVNGVYELTGQPYLTWKIKNPDPSSASRLQISKTEGGVTETSEYTWDAPSDSWSLSTGNGARVETKTVSRPTATSRTETFVVKDAAGQVASKKARTYSAFPWGEELVREVVDPDVAALTTAYDYYTDAAEERSYRKLKSVTYPDGSWEKYEYDADWNRSVVLRPWKDVTLEAATINNSRATLYRYTYHDGYDVMGYNKFLDGVEEWIEGKVVGATEITRWSAVNGVPITVNGHPVVLEEEKAYASLATQQLKTTAWYHASLRGAASAPDFLANRPAWVEHPDGRRDTYSYEKGNYTPDADPSLSRFTPDANGRGERVTVAHGTVASPDGIAFKTTKETTVRDQYGNVVLQEAYVYNGTDYERVGWAASVYNDRGQLTQTTRHNGRVSTAAWDGDRQTLETDDSGVETVYTYDALGRVKTRTKKGVAAAGDFPAQPDITATFTYDAAGRVLEEKAQGDSLSLTTYSSYDRAGRVRSRTDAAGLTTTYAYANGGRRETTTLPGGATQVLDKYLDGRIKSITGTAAVAQHFDYGVDSTTTTDGTQYEKVSVGAGGLGSPRWSKTSIDWLGRTIKVERPAFTGASVVRQSAYNNKGQLLSETTKSGAVRLLADQLHEYDGLGSPIRTGADVDASGTLLAASTDRMTETDTVYEKSGGDWFLVTTTKHYLADNDANAAVRTQRERLNNFAANGAEKTVSDFTLTDVAGNATRTSSGIDRAAKKVTTRTDTPESNTDMVSVSVNGLLQTSSPATPVPATAYAYDALGRQTSVTDPRSGTTTRVYMATGQLESVSDAVGTVRFEYYLPKHVNAGRLKSQTNAAGKKVYFNYSSRGEVVQTWGDARYPEECVYDAYGQKAELRTFRNGQNWAAAAWPAATTGAADVTRWFYHEPTGLLERKQDAATRQVTFGYDALGRPSTRAWARTDALGNALSTAYSYEPNTGELTGVNYSDSTPDFTLGYDRGGRQSSVTDAAGTHARTFNALGGLKTDQVTGGVLDGVLTSVSYDTLLRRQSLEASRGTTTLTGQTYGYDESSRLKTVVSGAQTATYAYHANSGLLNTTTFTGGTSVGRGYDGLGRLQTITTSPAAGAPQSYAYTYNSLHQRTRVTREDGSYWAYGYNDRGELTSGKKYWADNAPVLGDQTEYEYDAAGNRKSARSGGNAAGALRQSNYATNSLNQYAQRGVPGAVDVAGTGHAEATVTVNGQGTARKGDYFYGELAVDNGAGPVYAQVNVVGARNNFGAGGEDAVTEKGGRVFVPRALEAYAYDADGNLTSDGRWSYTWDAENRLVQMEAAAGVPAEARTRLEFAYDYLGRRVQKKVYAWDAAASGYQLQSVRKFVSDGWDVVAELDGNNAPVRSYVWGQDVTGTLQGAGGVGGLLLLTDAGGTFQAGYDGSGNLTTLVDAGTGAVAASYEYDPFGVTVKAVGAYAEANPFRFSTKYADAETGLLYYGHRYYQPQTGRWLSRDPLGEAGGTNLYGFVGNDPLTRVDPTGLYEKDVHYYLTYFLARQTGCFTKEEAEMVAEGNQDADENELYKPAQGPWHSHSVRPDQIGINQRRIHEEHHALTSRDKDAGHLAELMKHAAIEEKCDDPRRDQVLRDRLTAFGRYLHYVQDIYSHMKYPDPWLGHGVEWWRQRQNMPDKTHGIGYLPLLESLLNGEFTGKEPYSRVDRAWEMVNRTWEELKEYGRKNKCDCQPTDDNFNRTRSWIQKFLEADGGPDNKSIDEFPDLIRRKRNFLHVPPRRGGR
jgi:RHS repeat-associated protein